MIRITKTQNNHDIYLNNSGYFESIANNPQCQNTVFCSKINYIISLIYNYSIYKLEDFTEYGIKLIDKYLQERKYSRNDLFKTI